MSKEPRKADAPEADAPAVVAGTPVTEVKVEEGAVDVSVTNAPAQPKAVSTDAAGNTVEEL